MSRSFADTNVLAYAFVPGPRRAQARQLMAGGGFISVQTLNELTNVLRRKARFDWEAVRQAIALVRDYFPDILPLDEKLHDEGRRLAERYVLSIYDGLIVAAALRKGCDLLWSEDMHHGLLVEDRLRIVNPFVAH